MSECASCEHWRQRAEQNAADLASVLELRADRDRWRRQCLDLHKSTAEQPGPYEAHLYLVAAAEAEAALDRLGTRLALADRVLRLMAAGKPARRELDAYLAETRRQTKESA